MPIHVVVHDDHPVSHDAIQELGGIPSKHSHLGGPCYEIPDRKILPGTKPALDELANVSYYDDVPPAE